ncbi:MAG: HDOD domain-containing protein [Phycisphaerales bacterium]
MATSIEKVLACPTLPSLPAIAVELLTLTRDPDVSVARIASVVQNDPALSAKVLKTVNSSFYGLPQRCSKIDKALGFLGLNTVKSIVLGFSLVESTAGVASRGGLDMDKHWTRSIYAAAGARAVAGISNEIDPDEAFTATLFSDIGMLASSVALGDEYGVVLAASGDTHSGLCSAEQAALGFTHTQVGAELARKWNLSPLYEAAIAHHHDADQAPDEARTIVRAVAIGMLIAEILNSASPVQAMAELHQKAEEWFGIIPDQLEAVLNKVADNAQQLARVFDKKIGGKPDVRAVLSQASEQMLEMQLRSAQQTAELQRSNESLAKAATTDGLTGLSNRKQFDADLPRMFAECTSAGLPFAALFMDADKFKSVNDRFGHPAGDAVLVELARRASASIGSKGTVYRYGGEEFAVLLPRLKLVEAMAAAEGLRNAVERPTFDLAKVPGAPAALSVTVSVGVSATDAPGRQFTAGSDVVKAADEGVYEAKRTGRNRVCCAGPAQAAAPAPAPSPAPASMPAPTPVATLPAAITPIAPSATPVAAIRPSADGGLRILLVDDDPLSAKLLKAALQRQPGVTVTCVLNVDDATRLLSISLPGSPTGPHLVLTDYQLGLRTGLEVVTAVRHSAALRTLPTVVMSASEDPSVKRAALAAGASGFISKLDLATDMVRGVANILSHAARAA